MNKTTIFFSIFFLIFTNAISSEIVIVDINFILKNSNQGKSIQKELDKLSTKNTKKFTEKKKLLVTEEKKIASKKNILSKEDFNNEVLTFRKKIENYENERKKSSQEINNTRIKKVAKLLEQINKILLEYSSKNSISTIIDKKNIIITKEENDITKEILKILDS